MPILRLHYTERANNKINLLRIMKTQPQPQPESDAGRSTGMCYMAGGKRNIKVMVLRRLFFKAFY